MRRDTKGIESSCCFHFFTIGQYEYYHCDEYVAVSIAAFPISTEINLSKAATSNVYYKLEDTNIDDFEPEPGP